MVPDRYGSGRTVRRSGTATLVPFGRRSNRRGVPVKRDLHTEEAARRRRARPAGATGSGPRSPTSRPAPTVRRRPATWTRRRSPGPSTTRWTRGGPCRGTRAGGNRLQLGLLLPADGPSIPPWVAVSPALDGTDDVFDRMTVSERDAAVVVDVGKADGPTFEPFTPAADYPVAVFEGGRRRRSIPRRRLRARPPIGLVGVAVGSRRRSPHRSERSSHTTCRGSTAGRGAIRSPSSAASCWWSPGDWRDSGGSCGRTGAARAGTRLRLSGWPSPVARRRSSSGWCPRSRRPARPRSRSSRRCSTTCRRRREARWPSGRPTRPSRSTGAPAPT